MTWSAVVLILGLAWAFVAFCWVLSKFAPTRKDAP